MGSKPLQPKAWLALPKWAAARTHMQYLSRNANQKQGDRSYARAANLNKRNSSNNAEAQQSKFPRAANRERTLSAEKMKLSWQLSEPSKSQRMDKRWEQILNRGKEQDKTDNKDENTGHEQDPGSDKDKEAVVNKE